MEVEREILDIYRCFYMVDRIGERFEGTVSAFVGSGAFVTLDDPFVDVLVKIEDFGPDFVVEDDGLMARSKRSGDAVRLGDRILVEITDCALLRRTVYARRVRGEHAGADEPRPRGRESRDGVRGRKEPSVREGDLRKKRDAGAAADARDRPKRAGKVSERAERPRNAPPKRKNKGGPGPMRQKKRAGKKRR